MILLTNDDGIDAIGLQHLSEALASLDDLCVVAPDRERSAISMAITLHEPVGVTQRSAHQFAVAGTPVDCVHIALATLLDEPPALVVSGINHGANLGHDVHYSGTVAGAIQGTFFGVPSFAVSLVLEQDGHFGTAAHVACQVAKAVLKNSLPPGVLLNVNVPDLPLAELGEIAITRQDLGVYDAQGFEDGDRPTHFWIGGERQPTRDSVGTDLEAIDQGHVSITPIQLDLTAHDQRTELKHWF